MTPKRMTIQTIFLTAVQNKGSDIHIKSGSPPKIRISGDLKPLDVPPLTASEAEALVMQTMNSDTQTLFFANNEADYAYDAKNIGRFRINAYRTRGDISLVARVVNDHPTSLPELGMPNIVSELALRKTGLVLVTGATGSGKSSTLAGMVDHINRNRSVHIVTIEDPIETIHTDIKSSISQREVFSDTKSFSNALRSAMRQDPDVILIGEMRDIDTVRAALTAAETGHLVMSTLHTTDASEAITRIIDFFPSHEQRQVRISLSSSLQGIVSQRLVNGIKPRTRLPVVEVLVQSGRVAEAILKPDLTPNLSNIISEGSFYHMQSFDDHLTALVQNGTIDAKIALETTSNTHDLKLKLKKLGIAI